MQVSDFQEDTPWGEACPKCGDHHVVALWVKDEDEEDQELSYLLSASFVKSLIDISWISMDYSGIYRM